MLATSALRVQIETVLANRIPSALTPTPKMIRPVAATGIDSIDQILEGGLPVGAITEIVGPECSGRSSFAFSFVAGMTQAAKICAWVDVSNALCPESAAATGIDLARLLWIRCGVPFTNKSAESAQNRFALPEKYLVPPPIKRGLHGGGFGPHPRGEIRGLADAVSGLLQPEIMVPKCTKPQPRMRVGGDISHSKKIHRPNDKKPPLSKTPWAKLDQALRVADLLLQAGGFGAIVLDMGSIAPEYASRVPLATWFRYRAAAERTQTSILLLTQHGCAKSSAELLLRLEPGKRLREETTVFTGTEHRMEVLRQRFARPATNVTPLRKPPQRETAAVWRSQTTWTSGQ